MRVSSEPLAAAKTSASRMSPCAFRYSKAFSAAFASSAVVIILQTLERPVAADPAGEAGGARPRLRQVEVPLAVGRHPVGPQAGLREARDLAGELLGLGPRLALGHHAVGQPPLERLGRADGPAGEDHVERAAHADEPRQADRAAVDEGGTPAPAEDAELRAFVHHAEVAPEGQLQAPGDGVAVNGRDDGLAQKHPAGTHRAVPLEPGWIAGTARWVPA